MSPRGIVAGEVLGVQVRTNLAQLYTYLDRAARSQVPFATAVALTRLAQAGQVRVRQGLPHRFHLRSGWVARGIGIEAARKNDWPRSRATVGSRDDFMVLQETGGTKRPRKTRELALPGERVLGQLRSSTGRIPASRRPKRLKARKRYFLQKLVSGRSKGQFALLQRVSGERYPLRVVYIFRPDARVAPRLGFRTTVERRAQELYGPVFDRVLRQALATPKRPKLR